LKYLITGLGNPGDEYENTRHNIGFEIIDALADKSGLSFLGKRYAWVTECRFKSNVFILVKPTTYVNLSGKAVNYWMKKHKIPLEQILVVVDDVNLPFGVTRLRKKGGAGGHNGLESINEILGTKQYPRLRFGIGDNYYPGQQADYVLGEWNDEERLRLPELTSKAVEIIKSFAATGIDRTMNKYNL
jgi:peptidyl-tRNA hydrolase, PTH1 family